MLLSADPQKDWLMITELSAQIDFLGFQDSKKNIPIIIKVLQLGKAVCNCKITYII